jgi:hypothetical protein
MNPPAPNTQDSVAALIERFIDLAATNPAARDEALRTARATWMGENDDYVGLCSTPLASAFYVATWEISASSGVDVHEMLDMCATLTRAHGMAEAFEWNPRASKTGLPEEGLWRFSQWLAARGHALYEVDSGGDDLSMHFVVSSGRARDIDGVLLQLEDRIEAPFPRRVDPIEPSRVLRALLNN